MDVLCSVKHSSGKIKIAIVFVLRWLNFFKMIQFLKHMTNVLSLIFHNIFKNILILWALTKCQLDNFLLLLLSAFLLLAKF